MHYQKGLELLDEDSAISPNSVIELFHFDKFIYIAIYLNETQQTTFNGPVFSAKSEEGKILLGKKRGASVILPTIWASSGRTIYLINDFKAFTDESLTGIHVIKEYENVPKSGARGENKVTNEINPRIIAKSGSRTFSELQTLYVAVLKGSNAKYSPEMITPNKRNNWVSSLPNIRRERCQFCTQVYDDIDSHLLGCVIKSSCCPYCLSKPNTKTIASISCPLCKINEGHESIVEITALFPTD